MCVLCDLSFSLNTRVFVVSISWVLIVVDVVSICYVPERRCESTPSKNKNLALVTCTLHYDCTVVCTAVEYEKKEKEEGGGVGGHAACVHGSWVEGCGIAGLQGGVQRGAIEGVLQRCIIGCNITMW